MPREQESSEYFTAKAAKITTSSGTQGVLLCHARVSALRSGQMNRKTILERSFNFPGSSISTKKKITPTPAHAMYIQVWST